MAYGYERASLREDVGGAFKAAMKALVECGVNTRHGDRDSDSMDQSN